MLVTVTADTYTDSAHAAVNYLSANRLRLQGSGGTAYPYLMLKPPVTGPDVLYTSVVLRMRAATSWTACTLTGRRVTSSKSFSTITSSAQPSNTATGAVSAAIGAKVAGDPIELNVTSLVQGWAAGTWPNYGIRLDVGAVAGRLVYAAQTTLTAMRPVLEYTVFKKPGAPALVAPKAGQRVALARPSLKWTTPSDPLMKQVAYRVEMNKDTDDFSSSDYDSGWVTSGAGQHDLDFDIANGETWFWRVTIKNGGGQASDPSGSQEFGRTDKPTFSIISPSGGAITDSTPATEWSALSAGTQTAYRVQHLVDGVVKIDSGELPGADTSWTYDKPIPGFDSGEVITRVSLLDNVDRAATPGDSPWIVMETASFYTPGAVGPVDTIVVTQHATKPIPVVTVTRSSAPDRWDLQRSVDAGPFESVAIWDGPEAHTSGDEYEFEDPTAPPSHDLAYRVVAGENGIDSPDNPSGLIRIQSRLLWLLDENDDEFWVALSDRDPLDSFTRSQDSEAVYAKGAKYAQVIYDGVRGFAGQVSGGVYGTDESPYLGRTAQQMRDALIDSFEAAPTRVLRFMFSDYNIPVIITQATPVARPSATLKFGITLAMTQYGDA